MPEEVLPGYPTLNFLLKFFPADDRAGNVSLLVEDLHDRAVTISTPGFLSGFLFRSGCNRRALVSQPRNKHSDKARQRACHPYTQVEETSDNRLDEVC